MKDELKEIALHLRAKGLSYREIISQVPVAKSTLSLWLRDVGLTNTQKQNLTIKKLAAAKKGGQVRKQKRLAQIKQLRLQEKHTIGKLTQRELLLVGTALYWAEGSQQKEKSVSQRTSFDNSDYRMVKIFLMWLDTICNVQLKDLKFHLDIHESGDYQKALLHWSKHLAIRTEDIRVYFKKNHLKTNRKNLGSKYVGLMRITVLKSTALNRRISTWVEYLGTSIGE